MLKRKKWEFIEERLNSEYIPEVDLDMLDMLSRDRDEYIRSETAMLLYYSDSPRAEEILLRMLSDKSADVRSSVCRSLCISNSADTIETLKPYALSDTDLLVRGYSIFSISDIAVKLDLVSKDLIAFFEQGLQKEKEPWVMTAYYYELYIAGKEDYLPLLLAGLDNEDYRIRIMTANLLPEAANNQNSGKILAALDERLKVEDPATRSVISSIENAKKEIETTLQS